MTKRDALRAFMAQAPDEHRQITATGDALAEVAYDRGDRLTADERAALAHNARWGSDGYPIVRLHPKWTIDHRCAPSAPLYRTKRDAIRAWETLIAKWIRLAGLEARDRALAEIAASTQIGPCDYCGEPAGEGGSLCPACVANHQIRI